MDFSVAICTHNRAAALDVTLGTLSHLSSPGISYEMLIVDNASTDDTAAVAARWLERGLPLRTVAEAELGISSARNRAIESTLGDYLLFLDDDVNVSPDLLTAYHAATREYPDAPFMGGPIVPVFDGEPSPLARAIAEAKPGVFSALDLGPAPKSLEPAAGPWGANCCVRVACIGGERFDRRVSYLGRGGIVGDEVEFLTRIAARHGAGRWVPGAVVEHRIPPARATWAFVEKHARCAGRAQLRQEMLHYGHEPVSMRTVLWYERHYLMWWLRDLGGSTSLQRQVQTKYSLWKGRGNADEAWDLWRGRSPLTNPAAARSGATS